MATFDSFNDTPGQIRAEGQEITLVFQRTGSNTARISWNIPSPSNGCNSATQAYDGIIVTVSDKPANYVTTSPVDGHYYNADPTADPDVFTGDVLDGARVIGAFYHNKATKFLDITDVLDKTPYYVSAYAVDKVARYHREGVHAYSLPSGVDVDNGASDTPAKLEIGISSDELVTEHTVTGLKETDSYTFTLCLNNKKHLISIDGVDGMDYGDLVETVNKKLQLLTHPYDSPLPPNTNGFYVDVINKKLYQWNGVENTEIDRVIFSILNPAIHVDGQYWFDTSHNVLNVWNSSWNQENFIASSFDFLNPACHYVWFDGVHAYEWEKILWCQKPLYISTTNPLLPAILSCNTFWYHTLEDKVYSWDDKIHMWNIENVIYSAFDPNTLTSGMYWFDSDDSKLYFRSASSWTILSNVIIAERNADGDYSPSTPNLYWYIPSEEKLYRRNSGNTAWNELNVITYVTDPSDRRSCQLWWNIDAGVDTLYIWDDINSNWVQVADLFRTDLDPGLPPNIEPDSLWYNPDTQVMTLINNLTCESIQYVNSETNPMNAVDGTVWYNTVSKKYYKLVDGVWELINPIVSAYDPYDQRVDDYWFELNNNTLKIWDGSDWVTVPYSNTSLAPFVGQLWFDTVAERLREWNGSQWVLTDGIIYLRLVPRKDTDCMDCGFEDKDKLIFYTKAIGCEQKLKLIEDSTNTIFPALTNGVIYFDPIFGNSKLSSGVMYKQLGVGTDGSPDERRIIHEYIRRKLGSSVVTVELTKTDLDLCIDDALLKVRKGSSYAYTRALFFLDAKPNQQIYRLTSKCVGFNKIMLVNGIYRYRGAVVAPMYGDNSTFNAGAVQQLYRAGSFDMLSFHLVSSYMKELQQLFATQIMFQWVESTRELKLYKHIMNYERLLIDANIEKTEQDLFTSRETALWIKSYALALAKILLSQSRGKFQQLVGPNGGTSLNASELKTEAEADIDKLLEELDDFNMQDVIDTGMRSHFIIG